jgi:hypothetical protein
VLQELHCLKFMLCCLVRCELLSLTALLGFQLHLVTLQALSLERAFVDAFLNLQQCLNRTRARAAELTQLVGEAAALVCKGGGPAAASQKAASEIAVGYYASARATALEKDYKECASATAVAKTSIRPRHIAAVTEAFASASCACGLINSSALSTGLNQFEPSKSGMTSRHIKLYLL